MALAVSKSGWISKTQVIQFLIMSENKLNVILPLKFINNFDTLSLKDEVSKQIESNMDLFMELLERHVDIGDDARMTIFENSFHVEPDDIDLAVDFTHGVAHATFETHFHAGCKDMNSEDWHEIYLELV